MRAHAALTLTVASTLCLSAGDALATERLTLRSSWLDDRGAEPSDDGVRLARDDDEEDDEEDEAPKKKRSAKKSSGSSSGSGVQVGSQSSAGGVSPEGKQMGIGLQVGSPTGLTGKLMLTGNQGVQGGVGAGLGGLSIHADYLWHPQILATAEPFKLSWYLGLGGWLGFFPYPNGVPGLFYGPGYGWGYYNGHLAVTYVPYPFLYFAPSLAVRVPLGISVALRQLPIELFGGLTPSMLLFPGIGFGLGGEIGGRIYF